MQAAERQKRIEAFLHQAEFASLEELSELVDTSVSTVRRDVSMLEARGSIRRTHGGAMLINNGKSDEYNFSARDTHQLDEKEAIARACAALIKPNQTVIVDAGTTCYHVARQLETVSPHIVTNSLPVANHYSASSKVELVLTGGVNYPRLGVLVGPLAVEAFTKIHADVAIMSAGGITLDGLTNSHGLLIEIQRAMMRSAQKVIMCLDSTKFGRQSISPLCDLEPINTVVTDKAAPMDMVKALRKRGLEVILST